MMSPSHGNRADSSSKTSKTRSNVRLGGNKLEYDGIAHTSSGDSYGRKVLEDVSSLTYTRDVRNQMRKTNFILGFKGHQQHHHHNQNISVIKEEEEQ